jgi:pimeloyl-ACP methyl ester carboxylesterase
MRRIFILYGGLYSIDGAVTSAGMNIIADRLKPLGDVKTYQWASYERCASDIINTAAKDDKVAVIGYSGGGWRAATVCGRCAERQQDVNLLVAYDPSPSWNMGLEENLLLPNVKKAVCYHNNQKMLTPMISIPPWGWIGGGMLQAKTYGKPFIETVEINMNHLAVQYTDSLHRRTVGYVSQL